MKQNMMHSLLAFTALLLASAAFAEEPSERTKWHITGGLRHAPGIKSSGSIDPAGALGRLGALRHSVRRDPVAVELPSRAEVEASSGYTGEDAYYFDNGHILLDDAAGIPGETTHWRFDDIQLVDDAFSALVGENRFASASLETAVATEGGGRLSGSADEDGLGFYLEAGRELWASGRLSLGLSLGYAFYRDIDCFSFSGSLGNQIETMTLTEKSGVVQTLISQPEFVGYESDLENPDGTFGGDSPDGLPIAPGWSTPVLTVTPDRFSTAVIEDAPVVTTHRRPVGAGRCSADVSSELSLQELRLGVTPAWELCDRVRLVGGLGALVSYYELEVKTSLFSDGLLRYSDSSDEDEWEVSCYAGLSAEVALTDRLALSVGAEAIFPSRKLRYDDGLVTGEAELSDWNLFGGASYRF